MPILHMSLSVFGDNTRHPEKLFEVHLLCETISNSEGGFYPYLRSQRILTVLLTWLSPYKYWINTLFPFEVNLQLIKTLFP